MIVNRQGLALGLAAPPPVSRQHQPADANRSSALRMRGKKMNVYSAGPKAGQALPLDGYVRVSHVGGRGGVSFISPDLQEERIRAYARARDFEIALVHRELDRSGADRPTCSPRSSTP